MANVPVLIFGRKELPNIADSIWHAQMAGWERILTARFPIRRAPGFGARRLTCYLPNRATAEDGRFEVQGIPGHERDEYPFPCTVEGSSPSWQSFGLGESG
jgi:hypothetical protein